MKVVYIVIATIIVFLVLSVVIIICKKNKEKEKKESISVDDAIARINNDVSLSLNNKYNKNHEEIEEKKVIKNEIKREERKENLGPAPVIKVEVGELVDEEVKVPENNVDGVKEEGEPIDVLAQKGPSSIVIPSAPGTEIHAIENASNESKNTEEDVEVEVPDDAISVPYEAGEPAVIIETNEEEKITSAPVSVPSVEHSNLHEIAFHTTFDGNSEINQNFKYEKPKEKFITYKTEILDISEIKRLLEDEKNKRV